jgi:hypothetical protein
MNLDKEKLKNFDKLPADVRRQFSLLMNQYAEKKKQSTVRNDFMAFVKHVWPDFVEGRHHKNLTKLLKVKQSVLLLTWHLDIQSLSLPVTCYLHGW